MLRIATLIVIILVGYWAIKHPHTAMTDTDSILHTVRGWVAGYVKKANAR